MRESFSLSKNLPQPQNWLSSVSCMCVFWSPPQGCPRMSGCPCCPCCPSRLLSLCYVHSVAGSSPWVVDPSGSAPQKVVGSSVSPRERYGFCVCVCFFLFKTMPVSKSSSTTKKRYIPQIVPPFLNSFSSRPPRNCGEYACTYVGKYGIMLHVTTTLCYPLYLVYL